MGKLEIARLPIVVRQQSQHEVQGNTSKRNRHGAEEKLRLRWHVALLSGKSSLAAESSVTDVQSPCMDAHEKRDQVSFLDMGRSG
jgi:hypothetical protein